eukprot:353314-Chlamydomonas_euryale.AAC.1
MPSSAVRCSAVSARSRKCFHTARDSMRSSDGPGWAMSPAEPAGARPLPEPRLCGLLGELPMTTPPAHFVRGCDLGSLDSARPMKRLVRAWPREELVVPAVITSESVASIAGSGCTCSELGPTGQRLKSIMALHGQTHSVSEVSQCWRQCPHVWGCCMCGSCLGAGGNVLMCGVAMGGSWGGLHVRTAHAGACTCLRARKRMSYAPSSALCGAEGSSATYAQTSPSTLSDWVLSNLHCLPVPRACNSSSLALCVPKPSTCLPLPYQPVQQVDLCPRIVPAVHLHSKLRCKATPHASPRPHTAVYREATACSHSAPSLLAHPI